jgi:hypothetical protein
MENPTPLPPVVSGAGIHHKQASICQQRSSKLENYNLQQRGQHSRGRNGDIDQSWQSFGFR